MPQPLRETLHPDRILPLHPDIHHGLCLACLAKGAGGAADGAQEHAAEADVRAGDQRHEEDPRRRPVRLGAARLRDLPALRMRIRVRLRVRHGASFRVKARS